MIFPYNIIYIYIIYFLIISLLFIAAVCAAEDFTNRSHKSSIKVTGFAFEGYENIALGVGLPAGTPGQAWGTVTR
jgi:hypothetical protein